MGNIEQNLQQETNIELTQEMRRYLVKDLISVREYIESVLSNAIDGILVTSPAGLIIGSNASFKRLVGYTERELINQPITMVAPNIGDLPSCHRRHRHHRRAVFYRHGSHDRQPV